VSLHCCFADRAAFHSLCNTPGALRCGRACLLRRIERQRQAAEDTAPFVTSPPQRRGGLKSAGTCVSVSNILRRKRWRA